MEEKLYIYNLELKWRGYFIYSYPFIKDEI